MVCKLCGNQVLLVMFITKHFSKICMLHILILQQYILFLFLKCYRTYN